ncbi:hypothetical protein XBI1_1940004 [Xenorhabdus bovienii str. Intermedium]|uniref:Uncharacterized protein n=1 Tax=Xenorhabdus bovienii str. Intermedium TaxID=1379677 RepID=A0A077QGV1_XENBV|nr:hypothetical protein XBI1_1940004 [Xenorhabdus bovienii str. Intermedium]
MFFMGRNIPAFLAASYLGQALVGLIMCDNTGEMIRLMRLIYIIECFCKRR